MKQLGVHLHLELWECCDNVLNEPQTVLDALASAAEKANCTVVEKVIHQFSPQGVSGVVVLAEDVFLVEARPAGIHGSFGVVVE